MTYRVLVSSDRHSVEQSWLQALQRVGMQVQVVAPEYVSREFHSYAALLIDGSSAFFDDDELLALAALGRVHGSLVCVVEATGTTAELDLLNELCGGLVFPKSIDLQELGDILARRLDQQRGERFEYVGMHPYEDQLLVVLGNAGAFALARPFNSEDSGGEITTIELSEDGKHAKLQQEDGGVCLIEAVAVSGPSNDANTQESQLNGEDLGPRIKQLRLRKGLTQAEIARRTGIHRPNIARLEAGKHTPSLETLHRLADAIGVPTSWILSKEQS